MILLARVQQEGEMVRKKVLLSVTLGEQIIKKVTFLWKSDLLSFVGHVRNYQ